MTLEELVKSPPAKVAHRDGAPQAGRRLATAAARGGPRSRQQAIRRFSSRVPACVAAQRLGRDQQLWVNVAFRVVAHGMLRRQLLHTSPDGILMTPVEATARPTCGRFSVRWSAGFAKIRVQSGVYC